MAAPAEQQQQQQHQPRLPRDAQGFTQSFEAGDEEGIEAFFRQHGVVVVRGVLSEERVERTVDEIFRHPSLNAKTGAASKSRTDPADWEDSKWPTAAFLHKKGFISGYADFENVDEAWRNRQDPRVYQVFRRLLGRRDLVVKLDRYGVMRPTVLADGTEREDWLTEQSWLHWDQNPWSQPGFFGVQGLLALSDSTDDSGGFVCVPGVHADGRFAEWAAAHPPRKGGVIRVGEDHPINAEAEKVTARAGSLVVWDSRILHANFPNRSNRFRLVQYLTYMPAGEGNFTAEKLADRLLLWVTDESAKRAANARGGAAESPLEYDFPAPLDELGLRLIGAEPWPEEEE